MEMKAKKIVIKGKVHDVGYRLFLLSEAESGFVEKLHEYKKYSKVPEGSIRASL